LIHKTLLEKCSGEDGIQAALSGFRLLFGVSFAGGHGTLLLTVVLAMHG
jgi:hypothetical protein